MYRSTLNLYVYLQHQQTICDQSVGSVFLTIIFDKEWHLIKNGI